MFQFRHTQRLQCGQAPSAQAGSDCFTNQISCTSSQRRWTTAPNRANHGPVRNHVVYCFDVITGRRRELEECGRSSNRLLVTFWFTWSTSATQNTSHDSLLFRHNPAEWFERSVPDMPSWHRIDAHPSVWFAVLAKIAKGLVHVVTKPYVAHLQMLKKRRRLA